MMLMESDPNRDAQLARLLDALAPRLQTSKADLVAEIKTRLTELLGMEGQKAFGAVAALQSHAGSGLNLDRIHKSALVLMAHVLAQAMNHARQS